MVEHLPCDAKVKGLFPDVIALLKELKLCKGDSTVVKHLPYDPKVKGLFPAGTTLIKELT